MKSDEKLKTDVLEELRSEPSLHVIDIKVLAHEGTVTLSGTVKHFADKFAAERATQRVVGVKANSRLSLRESSVAVVEPARVQIFIPNSRTLRIKR